MRRFKNILLLFEDVIEADQAFRRAAQLAERNNAMLTLAHCTEAVQVDDVAGVAAAGGTWTALQDEWHEQLEGLAAPLRKDGLAVRTVVLGGIPFREAIGLVQQRGHDLLIKAARGSHGPRQLLFGSTDLHLIRKCPCPVWIHGNRAGDGGYGRIMAAVDVSDTTPVGEAMSRLILDLATSLGETEDSDVHVVHAWSSVGERMMTAARRGLLSQAEVARDVAAEEVRRQTLFEATVAPYLKLPVRLHLHLLHGDPREVLPLFVVDRQMDLLVMGTLARTSIPGFFIGNTAEDVLRQVDASVLTLKPEGFRSPVQ